MPQIRHYLPVTLIMLGAFALTSGCISINSGGKEGTSQVGTSHRDSQDVRKTLEALNAATLHRDVAATMALFAGKRPMSGCRRFLYSSQPSPSVPLRV